ncbi:hypothetical protein [Rhizorhabdus dicambivorans]|uniref:Uncharacterized protein n=1 Tax=Rhizorhabdus dicambivorans TaxID=1850238 RepID=A0A2A4G0X5_9SPHN|nr:hypothetical protein [Rhizorhabdus dicambivorans]ATE63440.1 hypothetical protein CMV14_02680 [Rhizorhabdus dicambivorans]PCE43659.1 hypothetical protein COO09_05000 [Rhizorhabdus dicambivorans]
MVSVRATTLVLALLLASPAAAATDEAAARSELFDKLLDCRSIAEDAGRLSCYDSQSQAVAAARKKGDLMVLSRQDLKETRRTLFGFSLPKFSLKGIRMDDPGIDRLEGTVLAASPAGFYWSVALDRDSGTWETTEAINRQPLKGDKVVIKKGVLGGYLGTIGNSNLVRFKRVF